MIEAASFAGSVAPLAHALVMADTIGIRLQEWHSLGWDWSRTGGKRDVWTKLEVAERQAGMARNIEQLNDARVEFITDPQPDDHVVQ